MKLKFIAGSVLLLLGFYESSAQAYSTVHPSPNIGWDLASLKQYNDLYTGTTSVKIPIGQLEAGKIKVPINLTYYNKAMQVDQLPSWVGLGWNLKAGGQITRVVNGKPDEGKDYKTHTFRTTSIFGGSASTTSTSVQVLADNDYAYIQNFNQLNNPNWNTYSYIFNTLNALPTFEVSNIITLIINYDNNTQTTTVVPTMNAYYNYDFEPDEFNFNVGNISGKFYLNHLGQWVSESANGNFLVEPLIANDIMKNGVVIPRLIYGFTLTGPDGLKYYFGGTAADKLKNIEYWRGPAGTSTGTGPDNVFNIFGNAYLAVCPSSWQLNRIEAPDNSFVNFEYKKGKLQLMYSDAPWGDGNGTSVFLGLPGYIHQSLAEPWYLTKITTSNNTVVNFNSEDSHQLGTNTALLNLSPHTNFTNFADVVGELITATNNLQKLTSIEIKDGTELIKTFQFEYTDVITERLKLTAVKEVFPGTGEFINKHSFTYNTNLLPSYGTGFVDHFGFYNNRRYFSESHPGPTTRAQFEADYYDSRESNFTYAKYETLDKVYFPTGGYRQFTYEGNNYSSSVSQWPFGLNNDGVNKSTGGIRISKIIDYSATGEIANETEFIYKSSLTGTLSSGILAVPRPVYTEDKASGGYYFATRSFIPFDRWRSHIAYSTVFEKLKDGSYIRHDFSNPASTGAGDVAPFYESTVPAFYDRVPFTDISFKRGLVKKVSNFNNVDIPVREEEFKYQDEYDNYTRYIRAIRIKQGDQSTGAGFRAAAYPIYYFPNVTRYKKEILKSTSGDMVGETNFTYDSYNQVQQTSTTNSKGQAVNVNYKYPYDFSSGSATNIYTKMLNRRMINEVVEFRKTVTRAGQPYLTEGEINDFGEFDNGIILPAKKYALKTGQAPLSSSVAATQYNTGTNALTVDPKFYLSTTSRYGGKANIVAETPFNGPKQSFVWSYTNEQYLVAKIINAENTQVYVPDVKNISLIVPPGNTTPISYPFTQYFAGNINISLTFNGAPNGSSAIKVNCSLSPSGPSQSLCIATTGTCNSSGIPQSATFFNVQPGAYTFNVSITENTSSPGTRVNFNYNDRAFGGTVEFFYEGFEQSGAAATATPYAGVKYHSGDYTVAYTKPNARDYLVNYHYLQNGVWKNMTKAFTNNMTLTEGDAIDEVRVYPSDALMTTYTYKPLVGMTSETDPNGRTSFFEYDNFQRLKVLRDQDGNIVKTYEYKFKQ
jgi:YD repeat-containing protein